MTVFETQLEADVERKIFRLGLAGAGALLLYVAFDLSNKAPLLHSPFNLALLLLSGLSGLGLLVCAGLAAPPNYLRWLILIACLGELFAQAIIWAQTSNLPGLTLADPGLYTELAGEVLRHGHNPFEWDYGGAYDLYRTNQVGSTARLNGAPESNYPYPALAILLVVPFQVLGLPGVFSLSVVAQALTLMLLFVLAPSSLQPLILLPIMMAGNFTVFTMIGNLDIIWVGLLVGMILWWRKPTMRALLYGLAIALKQSPWLIAPFLLIQLWHEDAERPYAAPLRFSLISSGTFLLVNGPFMALNFQAWLDCALEPLQDTLVVLSQNGLSGLTHFGLLYLPKDYYLFAMSVVLVVLFICYWRHYDILRNALWAMPGIFMWFSYRSLLSYWIYWAIPMLAVLITWDHTPPAPKKSWVPTWLIIAGAFIVMMGTGLYLATPTSPVQLRVQYPLWTTGGRVTGLTVEITNASDRTLAPRFSLQTQTATYNPLLWYIEAGPASLAPGESAIYRLSSQRDDRIFFTQNPAQLVVTDANGDYSLRGLTTLEPDRTFLWPDAITNPAYLYWDSYQHAPLSWTAHDEGTLSLLEHEGRAALQLSLNGTRARLSNTTSFPLQPFGIWLYSTPTAGVEYGLEVDDGEHRLRFLFGAQSGAGLTVDGTYTIQRVIPPDQWVYQEIDLSAEYAKVGWPLPPLKRETRRGLNIDWRLITLSLSLSAKQPTLAVAYFGPIEQPVYDIPPRVLMAESLNDPASHYLRTGEAYLLARNYARALEAYQRTLEFAPGDARALMGIEQAQHGLAGEGSK